MVLRFGVCISFAGIGASSGIQPMSGFSWTYSVAGDEQCAVGFWFGSFIGRSEHWSRCKVMYHYVPNMARLCIYVSIDEQQQRLQHYNQLVAGRSLQPSSVTISAGFPIIGLPNSNDCAVPTTGNGTGMMCGLGRGMALPRPGFPGLGSAGIPEMVSSGISNMLSSNGLGLPVCGPAPSGTIHVSGSMIQRPRDVQMLQGEDLKKQIRAAAYIECSSKTQQVCPWRDILQNVKAVFDVAIKVVLQPPKQKKRRKKKRICFIL